MKNILLTGIMLLMLLCGCQKPVIHLNTTSGSIPAPDNNGFRHYLIKAGNHYCEGNVQKNVELTETRFEVKFDSTAIYTTKDPSNQDDINKLWGFSDNDQQHHQYSARVGWRWSAGALRLFAYVYNAGKVSSRVITRATIGSVIACSITATSTHYNFVVNGELVQMPRMATTAKGKGYQLYPYFGGDETAPHQVNIWIKEG